VLCGVLTGSVLSLAAHAAAQCKAERCLTFFTPPPPDSPRPRRSVSGKYHTVTCLDVMIHYPQDKADAMISHLASLADSRLIISFAPKTPYYSILKRIGELFPGPSKVGGGCLGGLCPAGLRGGGSR
jgi:magnesium-protoporphyrin O-methyltransferase